MVQITARAHRQMLGDPPHHHRRLRTQARRQSHLHRIPLGPSFEIRFLPPPPLQLLRDDEFRLRLRRLSALFAVMLRPHPLAHLRQQLLPKRLSAQTPAAPNRLELLAFLRSAPFLYISISRNDPYTFTRFPVIRVQ